MKHLWLILFVIIGCSKKEVKPPNESIMKKIKAEVNYVGQDRWLGNEVYFNKDINSLVIKITISPSANEVAIKGYCNALQQIYYDNLMSRKFLGMIYQNGESIKSINENTRC